jgi:hypothetical protein
MVGVLHEKAILEAVDDILIGDVGDGGSHMIGSWILGSCR